MAKLQAILSKLSSSSGASQSSLLWIGRHPLIRVPRASKAKKRECYCPSALNLSALTAMNRPKASKGSPEVGLERLGVCTQIVVEDRFRKDLESWTGYMCNSYSRAFNPDEKRPYAHLWVPFSLAMRAKKPSLRPGNLQQPSRNIYHPKFRPQGQLRLRRGLLSSSLRSGSRI
jgi:hypothetical protein